MGQHDKLPLRILKQAVCASGQMDIHPAMTLQTPWSPHLLRIAPNVSLYMNSERRGGRGD